MHSALYFYENAVIETHPTQGVQFVIEKGEVLNFGSSNENIYHLKMEVWFPVRKRPRNIFYTLSAPITQNAAFIEKGGELDFYFEYNGRSDEHRKKKLWKIQQGDTIIVDEDQMSEFLVKWKSTTFGTAWLTGIPGTILVLSGIILFRRENKKNLAH